MYKCICAYMMCLCVLGALHPRFYVTQAHKKDPDHGCCLKLAASHRPSMEVNACSGQAVRPLLLSPIGANTEARLRQLFDSFDGNGDGFIEESEFLKVAKSLGQPFSDAKLRQVFAELCLPGNMDSLNFEVFSRWWDPRRNSLQLRQSRASDAVAVLRNNISKKSGLFFGFSFDQWRRAEQLKKRPVMSWSPEDVMLALSTDPSLRVVRPFLRKEMFADVDGESLVAITASDLTSKGIKPYHIPKLMRYVHDLQRVCTTQLEPSRPLPTTPREKRLPHPPDHPPPRSEASSSLDLKRRLAPPPGVPLPPVKRGVSADARSASSRARSGSDAIGTHWKKGKLIGQGSFGSVYIALNSSNGNFMALKEIEFADVQVNDVHALVKEISILKELEHPHIVRYLGSRIVAGQGLNAFLLFTEWVPGGSVKSVIENFGPLVTGVVHSYMTQVLEGLSYLHSHEIIHRDIKSANILVTDAGVIKLADFGGSKRLQPALVAGSAQGGSASMRHQSMEKSVSSGLNVFGTPLFMAPEALLDPKSCDGKKADVWAVGATVIEMVTTLPPWSEQHFENVMQLAFHLSKPDSAPVIPADLDANLRDFVAACFTRTHADRPSSAHLQSHAFIVGSSGWTLTNTAACTAAGDVARHGTSAAAASGRPTRSLAESDKMISDFLRNQVQQVHGVMEGLDSEVGVAATETVNTAKGDAGDNPFAAGGEFDGAEGTQIVSRLSTDVLATGQEGV